MTTRADILDEAKRIVTEDRNIQHGEPEDTFGLIAAYWSAHLDHPVSAADVAVMMIQLKLARLKANPRNRDNWLDGIGYLACGAEIAAETLEGTAGARNDASGYPCRRNDDTGPVGQNPWESD